MVRIVAHRGSSRQAVENTLDAFQLARRQGADGVELDARLSADGVLLVHHDRNWSSRLPGVGGHLGRAVAETLAAARPLAVPTLAEVLDTCDGMLVNIELKTDGIAGLGEDDGRRADAARDRLAGALVELLSERGGRDQVLVSSFDAAVLDLVAARSPACRLGWLTEDRPGPAVLARLAASGHVAVHPHWTVIDAGLVEATHRAGLAVFTWTVDDPASVAQLATLGVDAIITNVPDVALLSLGRGPG